MEPVPQSPQFSRTNKKLVWAGLFSGIIVLVMLITGGIDADSISSAGRISAEATPSVEIPDRPLSVYETWQRAEELDGQVIRVQGKHALIS